MFYWIKERRRKKRFNVTWNAVFEIRFPDYISRLKVKLANFSGVGALLLSNVLECEGRPFIVSDQYPDFKLIIFSPQGMIEVKSEILWYDWSIQANAYEIGVRFLEMNQQCIDLIDNIIEWLYQQK